MKLVVIEWEDAAMSSQGWDSLRMARRNKTEKVRSVGYLVKRGKKKTIIAMGFGEGQVADALTIPSSCVRKMRRVKDPLR